jgi:hypothetical protein
MNDELSNADDQAFPSPHPNAGYQTEIIREVERLVSALPPGAATLRISRVPDQPDWPEPYFIVTPVNSKAARFEGAAVADDLVLTVGEAQREIYGFSKGGRIVSGANWLEELRWIWQAVIAGFTERRHLDSRGEVIGCATKLLVNGHALIFQSGRRAERLFGKSIVQNVTYEPYSVG